MNNDFSTLGYGFHLEETRTMLNYALTETDQHSVKEFCIHHWPQKSDTNKVKMWNHLSKRYFDIYNSKILHTPFINLYKKLSQLEKESLDLIFLQLCSRTPIVYKTLHSLATDSFLNTGEAVFSKYHLDQLLESIFGHIPRSTCERIRQILIKAGRLLMSDSNYTAIAYCPSEAVLGYALYQDAQRNGWRAPSSTTIMEQGTICTIFLCNRPLLIAGITRLSSKGYCEYHRHGPTDQVLLTHRSLEEFVDAWK